MPRKTKSGDAEPSSDLAKYNEKRRFDETPEPRGTPRAESSREPIFVIQMHHASRMHFDFRVEADGVLKSWAVPKGPTLDTREKRFAAAVEDHPFDYHDFEGIIPEGNYGAGEVIVWDRGTYRLLEGTDATAQIAKGSLKIELFGEKLHGGFAFVKMKSRDGKDNAWLLIKERDDAVDPTWKLEDHLTSVASGRTVAEVANDPKAPHWKSNRPAVAQSGSGTTRAALAEVAASIVLPEPFEPMLAAAVDAPFDDERFLYEIKWDGYRALARIERDGSLVLQSRGGIDFAPKFDEFAGLAGAFSERPAIIDGEIVVLDERGNASFEALQSRLDRFGRRKDGHAATFVVFDCCFGNGRDLRAEPLEERKRVLESILTGTGPVMYSQHVEGQGVALFELARAQRLEGIIAKRRDSPYRSRRTREWLKMKTALRQEFVVGGWTEGRSSRKHFGSLVLGVYDGETLVPAGTVGSGFDGKSLASIAARLAPLERHDPPFARAPKTDTRAHWVAPDLVAEVSFAEWTRDGVLRQPTFVALREDRDPRTVVRERTIDPGTALEAAAVGEPERTPASAGRPKAKPKRAAGPVGAGAKREAAFAERDAAVPAADRKREAPEPSVAAVPASSPSDFGMRARRAKSVSGAESVRIGDRTLALTNRNKILFPADGITKGDLIDYYRTVSPWMLPHLAGRPLTLERFPDGIAAPTFFEKHKPRGAPAWVPTVSVPSDAGRKSIDYVLCNDEATLAYCANLGAIVLHVWTSHVPDLDRPEFVFFDLDPWDGCTLATLAAVALGLRDLLAEIGLDALVKTSGGTGLHVAIPLELDYAYDDAKVFAEIAARTLHGRLRALTTLERATAKRPNGTVYLDYVQVGRGKTLVPAYGVRARNGAPVSMPIGWDEVREMARSGAADSAEAFARYTMRTVPALLSAGGDAWDARAWRPQRLESALERAASAWGRSTGTT